MQHPFVIVLIMAGLATTLNIWYMIRSKRLHDICVKKRKINKNKNK